EDRSYAEIAEVLGVTVPAVEALLFRARGSLRARRNAIAGTLGVVPLPASLASFFGGGSGGLIAAGGAALGSEVALKVAAVVATGAVVGGLGYKGADVDDGLDARAHGHRDGPDRDRSASAAPLTGSARARNAAIPHLTGNGACGPPSPCGAGDLARPRRATFPARAPAPPCASAQL